MGWIISILIVGMCCLYEVRVGWGQEPFMQNTVRQNIIPRPADLLLIDILRGENPPCKQEDKKYTHKFGKLASVDCRYNHRWRPWVCKDGSEGADYELLPECWGK